MLSLTRRHLLAVAGITLGGFFAPRMASAASESGEASGATHRVALHLNSDAEGVQKGALNMIKNLYEEYGRERVKVELIANGPGLKLFLKKETRFADELERLKKAYGVEYAACSNTMKVMKVAKEDLVTFVDRTPPAVVRLIELQEQGWAYIKP